MHHVQCINSWLSLNYQAFVNGSKAIRNCMKMRNIIVVPNITIIIMTKYTENCLRVYSFSLLSPVSVYIIVHLVPTQHLIHTFLSMEDRQRLPKIPKNSLGSTKYLQLYHHLTCSADAWKSRERYFWIFSSVKEADWGWMGHLHHQACSVSCGSPSPACEKHHPQSVSGLPKSQRKGNPTPAPELDLPQWTPGNHTTLLSCMKYI